MHRVLKGGMATVGFIFPASVHVRWIHEAAIDLLNDLTPKRAAYHMLFDPEKGRSAKGNAHDTRERLAESHLLFGFATEESNFHDGFRAVADGILTLGDVDDASLQSAFRAIMKADAPAEMVFAASKFPDGLLNAVIKRGRRLQDVISILQRVSSHDTPATTATTIENLSGYGEAAEWGKALIVDLDAYNAGYIEWADVDRGALISGPSGTGKTFFVQALATSCSIPLYAHSLMSWQAKGHLGDLLGAMRAAFKQAAAGAPSILFLDECDAFGSRESFSGDNAHYCSEVVNGLLECIDGVEKRTGVVVIGATNFPERIDPALLRPGRLGRHLSIELPDVSARSGILGHHLGNTIPEADLSDVAARLEGATGALIEQTVRDARRRARTEAREPTSSDLASSLPPRRRLTDAAFTRTCVHEAGHAVVGYVLREEAGATPVAVAVFRETIPSRPSGYTEFHRVPGLDRSRRTYDAAITTLLAGLASEKIVLGEHGDSGGGSQDSDLYHATVLAAGLHISFGLEGPLAYLGCDTPDRIMERVRSDHRLRRRVDVILRGCFERAESILRERQSDLQQMADILEREHRLDASAIVAQLE
jgi:ATP-dependent Zn protease